MLNWLMEDVIGLSLQKGIMGERRSDISVILDCCSSFFLRSSLFHRQKQKYGSSKVQNISTQMALTFVSITQMIFMLLYQH